MMKASMRRHYIDPETRVNIIKEPELGMNRYCLGQKPTGKTFVAKLVAIDKDALIFENSNGEKLQNYVSQLLRLVVI